MISFEESQRLLDKYVKSSTIVEVPLIDSLGLVLATPVIARTDSPRFDASAVDGYAVSLADFANCVPVTLPIAATIHAGTPSARLLKPGKTMRILTGASVPKGANAIVMQENVTIKEETVSFFQLPECGANIRTRGAEYRRGERLFEKGTVITPAVAQTLASCGFSKVKVHARPSVSILITGDELRTPGSKLKQGEIWDSNSIALEAALRALGITDIRPQHVSDNSRDTARAVRRALERSDIVIATGGVSVGERDYVKEAFASNDVREIFWRVSIRPGMPIYFGTMRKNGRTKYVFGLPGNPVSVMATYLLFVRRAILRMMGLTGKSEYSRAVLSAPLKKSISRTEFVRARREWTDEQLPRVVPLTARESHMTTSMAHANSLIVFPAGEQFLAAGSEVDIIPIQWGVF